MHHLKQLNEMEHEEKVAFFQTCQDLLKKNQPNSEFILREGNPTQNAYYQDLFLKYKGFVYASDRVAMMFNKHHYKDGNEAKDLYHEKVFDPPDPKGNTYSIDFITSKMTKELCEEIQPVFEEKLDFVVFLRNGKISFFESQKFVDAVLDSVNA